MSTSLDLLSSKLERAKKHIRDLQPEWTSFFKSGGYVILPKDDPDKGERSYCLAIAQDIPPVIALTVGDALHNLRSTLDHLAYHLVWIGTSGAGPFRHVYFPIAKSAEKYKTDSPGKIEGMRQSAKDAIGAIEPYRGGRGHNLWQLHELNNIDKHRLILTVYGELLSHRMLPWQRAQMNAVYSGSHPGETPPDLSDVHIMPSGGTRRLKQGDVLLTVPTAELEDYMNFVIDISFGEPQIIGGNSVIHTLERMAQTVEAILINFAKMGLLV